MKVEGEPEEREAEREKTEEEGGLQGDETQKKIFTAQSFILVVCCSNDLRLWTMLTISQRDNTGQQVCNTLLWFSLSGSSRRTLIYYRGAGGVFVCSSDCV